MIGLQQWVYRLEQWIYQTDLRTNTVIVILDVCFIAIALGMIYAVVQMIF